MSNYDKLNGREAVDKDLLAEYVEAKREYATILARFKYLERLLNKNNKLEDYIWVTANGEVKAISDLEDSHLLNIVKLLTSKGRRIPTKIEDEVYRRKLEATVQPLLIEAEAQAEINLDEIPW